MNSLPNFEWMNGMGKTQAIIVQSEIGLGVEEQIL